MLPAYKTTIYEALETLRDTLNATAAEYSIELPTRQYFDSGGPNESPHDCEEVVFTFEQMYNGFPSGPNDTPTTCEGPRTATFSVEIVRCTPTPKRAAGRTGALLPPDIAELDALVSKQGQDAWLLMDAGLKAAEQIGLEIGGLADVVMGQEAGGFQATVLNLTVGLLGA